jgi:hypothetical protein
VPLRPAASFPNAAQSAAELRAFPWLHIGEPFHMKTEAFRAALFNALLRHAPEEELRALQWRYFSIPFLQLTDELAPLLCRLPSLDRLPVYLFRCTCFDFLVSLPRLTHLEIYVEELEDHAWANLVAVFTSDGLTRLHTLELHYGQCSSDDLGIILSHTPSLTRLTLDHLRAVNSLDFFDRLPNLTVQCGVWCKLGFVDLWPLRQLRQLRVLYLLDWARMPPFRLTAGDLAPFQQRPCAVLPHLKVFQWTAVRI